MNERDTTQQHALQPQKERSDTRPIELFALSDLACLREEMRQAGLDTRQVAVVISNFLTERGYGVSLDEACKSVAQGEVLCGSFDRMQAGLAALAVSM